jgi:DNA polymerase/3'-5' exonuclease PolX
MEHGAAFLIADEVMRALRPSCERIEMAGSLVRAKKEVKDIELIAIPKFMPDLFGETLLDHSLDIFNWASVGVLVEGKHKMKKIDLHADVIR